MGDAVVTPGACRRSLVRAHPIAAARAGCQVGHIRIAIDSATRARGSRGRAHASASAIASCRTRTRARSHDRVRTHTSARTGAAKARADPTGGVTRDRCIAAGRALRPAAHDTVCT